MIRIDLSSALIDGATSLVSLLALLLVLGALILRQMVSNMELPKMAVAVAVLLWIGIAIAAIYLVGRESAPQRILTNVSTSGGPGWIYHWDFPLDGSAHDCRQVHSGGELLEGKCRGYLEGNNISVVFYGAPDENHCSLWGEVSQNAAAISGEYFCIEDGRGIQGWKAVLAD